MSPVPDEHDSGQVKEDLLEREKFITIGRTTAVVAHELRNPLATIRNSLYLLSKLVSDDTKKRIVDRAVRNIERCDKIIQELLDYSRNTNEKTEQFDPNLVIDGVIKEMEIPETIELRMDYCASVTLVGVPSKLERSVINIVQNAIDAINGGRADKRGAIYIRTFVKDTYFVVLILNDGPFIEEHHLEKIFEPLFSTKGFGVGLGLPIARKMFVEHHGGLTVFNIPNLGVAFYGWMKLR